MRLRLLRGKLVLRDRSIKRFHTAYSLFCLLKVYYANNDWMKIHTKKNSSRNSLELPSAGAYLPQYTWTFTSAHVYGNVVPGSTKNIPSTASWKGLCQNVILLARVIGFLSCPLHTVSLSCHAGQWPLDFLLWFRLLIHLFISRWLVYNTPMMTLYIQPPFY